MPENAPLLSAELRDATRSRTFDAVSSVMEFTDDTVEKYHICIVAMLHVAGMATGMFVKMHPEFEGVDPADVFRGIVERLFDPDNEDGSVV